MQEKTKTDYSKQICSRVESGGEITLGPENHSSLDWVLSH